jgi:hypothetical protein
MLIYEGKENVKTINDDQVNRTFEFLNQYPKFNDFAIQDDGVTYEAETFKTGLCNTLEEAIGKTLKYIAEIVEKSDMIWLRVFPELKEFSGQYLIRMRLSHKDRDFFISKTIGAFNGKPISFCNTNIVKYPRRLFNGIGVDMDSLYKDALYLFGDYLIEVGGITDDYALCYVLKHPFVLREGVQGA